MASGSNPSCKLCTDSFTEEDLELLMTSISDLGLMSYLSHKDKDPNKPQIKFSTKNSLKLMKVILPHMHKTLMHKVDENVYLGATYFHK